MLPTTVVTCSACGATGELGNGPGGRPRASCGRCGSLERHRGLLGMLGAFEDAARSGIVLDVAPTPQTCTRILQLAQGIGQPYLSVDFDPAADGRRVDLQASLTDLPFSNDSVGLMVCFHVLEHIPDDAAAMSEIARVLAPGGVAIIAVPQKFGVPTDEDPAAPPEERIRRFGQADHVRYYGDDFGDRLRNAGLTAVQARMGDLYGELETDILGIDRSEPFWFCTVGPDFPLPAVVEHCAEQARSVVMSGLERIVSERATAQAAKKSAESELALTGARAGQATSEVKRPRSQTPPAKPSLYRRLRRKAGKLRRKLQALR